MNERALEEIEDKLREIYKLEEKMREREEDYSKKYKDKREYDKVVANDIELEQWECQAYEIEKSLWSIGRKDFLSVKLIIRGFLNIFKKLNGE